MAQDNRNRGVEFGMKSTIPGAFESRFGRMFDLPSAAPLSEEALRDIAKAMIKEDAGNPITEAEVPDENPAIPAGYTYFGQFIDHDITFDPTPLNAATLDPEARIDFRSPALDLDSVYGRGPADQPYLYDYPFLRVGQHIDSANARFGSKNDVFRVPASGQRPLDRPEMPILGDKRNDENKIVSQMHGVLIALHNRFARGPDIIRAAGGNPDNKDSVFATAANLTRWHYQWVVLHDYIARVCEPGTVAESFEPDGVTPRLPNYRKPKQTFAYMPVEFAAAAFRFGYSMIRPSYALNRFTGADATTNRIPLFSRQPSRQNLNGFPGTVPDTWGIDWGYFLEGLSPNVPAPGDSEFRVPQPSYRIDALLVQPLADLPEFRSEADKWVQNLAFRNLSRGQGVPHGTGLPSGEAVSRKLMGGKVTVPADKIWDAGSRLVGSAPLPDDFAEELNATRAARKTVFDKWVVHGGKPLANNTPLWFYILREAEYYGVTAVQTDPGIAFGG